MFLAADKWYCEIGSKRTGFLSANFEVEHFHTIQNIYNALSGKEIELKP